MDPILTYLRDGVLPLKKKDAKRILYQATNYTLIEGKLYKYGLSFPLLRCLHLEKGRKVFKELHTGVCSNHIRSQGKLALNWEDPVRVKEDLGNGAYMLEIRERLPITRTWNARNL